MVIENALDPFRYSALTENNNNYALFAGGSYSGGPGTSSTPTTKVEAYDTSLTRTVVSDLNNCRESGMANNINNYILFAGGTGPSSTIYNTVEAYNSSLTKSTPTNMSANRQDFGSTHNNNYALFAGGYINYSTYNNYTTTNTVDAYNSSLTKSSATALSSACYSPSGGHVGNYALFAGGGSGQHNGGTLYKTVTAYNDSLTKSSATNLTTARSGINSAHTSSNVLFIGGRGSNEVESYNSSLTKTTLTNFPITLYAISNITLGPYALLGGTSSGKNYNVYVYDDSLTLSTGVVDQLADGGYNMAARVGIYGLFCGGDWSLTPLMNRMTVYRLVQPGAVIPRKIEAIYIGAKSTKESLL